MAGPVASYKQFGFGLYLVALKETGVPIGICGLLKRESMQDIEIGFAFDVARILRSRRLHILSEETQA